MTLEHTMYWITSAAFAVSVLLFSVWLVRAPADRRTYLAPLVLVPVMAAGAYASMGAEILTVPTPGGRPAPLARFVENFLSYAIMLVYMCVVAGASRRYVLGLLALDALALAGTVGTWLLAEPQSVLAYFFGVTMMMIITYVLIRPLDRFAAERDGELTLLYGKHRNIALLGWWLLNLTGFISRQGLGLLDAFTGIFIGIYVDLFLRIGFVAIAFRSPAAIDLIAERMRRPVYWVFERRRLEKS